MLADLQLSLIVAANPRSRPVLDGTVKPEGVEFVATAGHPSEIFWRQLHFKEFDVSEMSLSSLLIALAQGNRDWVGIPVFTTRRFFHTGAWVRRDAGIERPQDLTGKRVGVPEYQQTAALWARGILQHEFGVSPGDMEWWMERTEERSHGGATGFEPPAGLRFQRIPAEESMASLLLSGRIDAALLYLNDNNLVDRSRVDLRERPEVRLLFPDPQAENRRYYAKTGIWPINHGLVVRREIAERHPWVVRSIFNAFQQAKAAWLARVANAAETHLMLGLLPPDAEDALRRDPYPYGVTSNVDLLQTLAAYSYEQGLTPRLMGLDEVFAPGTLDL